MNLLLLEVHAVSASGVATLTGPQARHAIEVLKVTPGKAVRVGLLNGSLGSGIIVGIEDRTVTLQCAFEAEPPVRPHVDVLLALPRPKVLRRLWAQLAALGVGRIMLTNAERVERDYFDTHVITEACYRPLLIEGLQQARDTWLPAVSVHKQFKVLIEDDLASLFPGGRRLVAHPGCGDADIGVAAVPPNERVLLAVGPEGGWNTFELQLLAAHGFQAFDMGGRTLRSDTACIALLTLIHAAMRVSHDGTKATKNHF